VLKRPASSNGCKLNTSSTIITVTLTPTDFANDNPCITARSANSDPSVDMRIWWYLFHLPILPQQKTQDPAFMLVVASVAGCPAVKDQ
jgi:hypothetical protein